MQTLVEPAPDGIAADEAYSGEPKSDQEVRAKPEVNSEQWEDRELRGQGNEVSYGDVKERFDEGFESGLGHARNNLFVGLEQATYKH